MKLKLDQAEVVRHGLALAGQLAGGSLRIIENYRKVFRDVDDTVITLVVMAMASDGHAACNITSVAAASGLARETVRRKIGRMVEIGVLLRDARGAVRLSEGFLGNPDMATAVERHAREVVRLCNILLDHKAVSAEAA